MYFKSALLEVTLAYSDTRNPINGHQVGGHSTLASDARWEASPWRHRKALSARSELLLTADLSRQKLRQGISVSPASWSVAVRSLKHSPGIHDPWIQQTSSTNSSNASTEFLEDPLEMDPAQQIFSGQNWQPCPAGGYPYPLPRHEEQPCPSVAERNTLPLYEQWGSLNVKSETRRATFQYIVSS